MERFTRTHRLLSSTLVAVLGLGFPAPSFALRPEPVAEKGAGLEELTDQLQTQTPDQRADLILAAKRYVEESFSVGRAVAVAGHGRNARIPKRLQNVADYVESSVAGISPQQEGFPGSDEVRRMDPAAAHAVEWAQRNVRFVVVSDDENGFLAANGVAGTDSHVAVVAYAGWYPYPGWEKGMAPQMVEQIKGGMRALQQGSTLSRERFAGPPTVYLSETQVRSFMEGGDRGNQAFQIKLAHELKDIFNKGKPGVRPPAADVRIVDGYIAQSMQAIQEAKRKRKEAAAQREASKLTKFHVTADLSGLLSAPASAQQRRQITQRVEETLRGFQKDGIIFGFDVHLFNQGKMLVVDLDYREGGDPTQKPAGVAAIQSAVRRGVLEAQTLGLTSPGSETELLSRVVLHSGENRLTQRASEPIVTVQAMGLGMGAFNRVIWHLLVGDVGHLQAVGGERGFRVVVANLSDIREGKKQYRTYEFETPGISEQKIKEIIRKLQANEMTEEDLKDAASRNLHQLHRLIGAMDEYAIEGVYPLAGSRFAAKEGKEPVTLTDEPIIKVHLHEDPQGDFRGQSGAWATGSYQKVLTLPHFAPNAEQTRWVGMIPVTLQEAEDLSVLENDGDGWPVGEMGFMTAWAWSYDRGGTGRGEPPVTDVFGKNNQAQINRRVLQPLMKVWKGLANFEPRLTAEEAARRASAAAAQFLSVKKTPEGVPPTGVWHPIPDLKKREVDPVVQRFQGEGKLTWSFFKADIGGKAGHDQVLQTHMAAARAKLAEAKEKGLIEDYKVFFVGDDMQLAILHKNGIQSEKMHALAWQVFSFGYWVSYTIGLEPYGHAQDIRIAELFHKFPIEHHAQLSRRAVELLKADFERAAGGQADVPDALKANAQTALSSALVKWEMLEGSLKKWEMGDAAGTVVAEAVAVGNVTGMGIGWGEMPAEEGVELAYDGLDKSGAGGFNTRLASMMADAIAAGDVRPTDIVEMWDVEQHRRIFLRVGEEMEQILDMAAQVNKYNFKRFLDGETWGIKSWLSSEILAQTAHGYVGKDDPILLMEKRVGRHMAETFRDPQRAATAQLGDEAGTHNLANVLRAWWESFPGEKSNPVGASITFRIRDGKIEMEDEGSKREYNAGRVAAEDFNRMLVGVQGEFSPQVANRRQVEETYPRARMLDEADRNPTAWVDRADPLSPAAGLEEGTIQASTHLGELLQEIVASNARFVLIPPGTQLSGGGALVYAVQVAASDWLNAVPYRISEGTGEWVPVNSGQPLRFTRAEIVGYSYQAQSSVISASGLKETWDRAKSARWIILQGQTTGRDLLVLLLAQDPSREIADLGTVYLENGTVPTLPLRLAINNPFGLDPEKHLVAIAPSGQVGFLREGELTANGGGVWYQALVSRARATLTDDIKQLAGLPAGLEEVSPEMARDRELVRQVVEGDQVGAPIDLGDAGLALVVPARSLGLRSDFYLHAGLSQPDDLPPGIEVMDLPEDQAGFRNALAREVVFDTDFILLNARHVTDPTGWIPILFGNPARIRMTETESETASVLDLVAAGRWSRLIGGIVDYGSLKITYVTVNEVIYAVIRSA